MRKVSGELSALGSLGLGLLAAMAAVAQQPLASYRSVSDVRPRIPDEHDRPYFRETQTHRGWEVREPQFTVFAATSADDARWAAGHVAAAWNEANRLADRWTSVHHNPDFGLSALQVAINNEPVGARYLPATTIASVGIQTQVTLNVGPGQPNLPQQVVRLREAVAFGMLHTAGVDSVAPPWVVKGLAAFAGHSGLTKEELESAVDPPANMGGEQWRFRRSDSGALAYAPLDQNEAASRVGFFLHGDDARFAPLLFNTLREATTEAQQSAADGKAFETLPGDPPTSTNTVFDKLLASLGTQYAAWKHDPHEGEPIFEPASGQSAELVAAEREMVVLLKLKRRLDEADKSAAADAVSTAPRGKVSRTKVINFDKARGVAVSEPLKRSSSPMPFAAFAARLTDSTSPAWATLDVEGRLLLSADTARVQSLLAINAHRYEFENDGERTVLVRQMENRTTLRGWLENDPENKSRPVAKFRRVGANSGAGFERP